jgi:transglutaminase-like putative cysteine protease
MSTSTDATLTTAETIQTPSRPSRRQRASRAILIRVGYDIVFDSVASTPMVTMLHIHPSRQHAIVRGETLHVDPAVRVDEYVDGFGNRCGRLVSPRGRLRFWNDAVVLHSGEPDRQAPGARQHEVDELPDDALQFLVASRYCEVDRLMDTAWELFGSTPPGWARVEAICNYVHSHIRFDYSQARHTRTASEAHQERVGVCRDFTHLAIAFCRCLNIPARYCTGYLGDIGVPAVPDPMDFSAWFEVYLGDDWYTFDARHNVPRIGRVLMARGRDATDVALLTSFGANRLERFEIWSYEAHVAAHPLHRRS